MSEGNYPVTAVVKTSKGFKLAGAIFAEPNCWSMLKGGLTMDTSGVAELYFEVLLRFIYNRISVLLNLMGKNKGIFFILIPQFLLTLQNAKLYRATILLWKFGSIAFPYNHSQKSNGDLTKIKVLKR